MLKVVLLILKVVMLMLKVVLLLLKVALLILKVVLLILAGGLLILGGACLLLREETGFLFVNFFTLAFLCDLAPLNLKVSLYGRNDKLDGYWMGCYGVVCP